MSRTLDERLLDDEIDCAEDVEKALNRFKAGETDARVVRLRIQDLVRIMIMRAAVEGEK